MFLKALFLVALVFDVQCDFEPTKILRIISHTIGTHVLACQMESKFGDEIIAEFMSYWNASTGLDDPNMGCVFKCVLDRLELLDARGDLRLTNAKAFLIASGSNENISKALAELYQMCRRFTQSTEPCELSLNIARCFRAGVFMLEWTPNLKDPVPEVGIDR